MSLSVGTPAVETTTSSSRKRPRRDEPTNKGTTIATSHEALSSKATDKVEEKDNGPQKESDRRGRRHAKKQKRQIMSTTTLQSKSTSNGSKRPKGRLHGMLLSVSTRQATTHSTGGAETTNQEEPSSSLYSYNQVVERLKQEGAQVSSQVHKKVTAVLCTTEALQQGTQRIRKAIQRNIPIWHVEDIFPSSSSTSTLAVTAQIMILPKDISCDTTKYEWHPQFKKEAEVNKASSTTSTKEGQHAVVKRILDPNAGWSEPVSIGCCCVCHENGTQADCPWCTECSQ